MKPSLFRNYILLSIAVTVGVFILGASITQYVSRLQREKREPPPNMTVFMARMIDHMEAESPVIAFAQIKDALGTDKFRTLWLTDAHGEILASTEDREYSFDWSTVALPATAYERTFPQAGPDGTKDMAMMPPPPPGPVGFGGPPRGPPPAEIVRLATPGEFFLVSEFKPREGFQNDFLLVQVSLFASIVVASLVTFGLISWHLRSRAISAEQVMSELQKGNLKARFPIQRNDEIGRIMALFNRMSDEIERLVEKTRANEQARMFILQELAHDLRTPIASLKSMLETLSEGREKIPQNISDELFEMSLEEVNYFDRLVEDLLLLAQVLEPEYHAPHKEVNWKALLEEEVERLNTQQMTLGSGKQAFLAISDEARAAKVLGDVHLLRRVFRNLLQNAMTFAKSEVRVQVGAEGAKLQFKVRDDGPGFSTDILSSYGERRFSRFINEKEGVHLSVGLGAVIVKKVVNVHGGDLNVTNLDSSGAQVSFFLPKA